MERRLARQVTVQTMIAAVMMLAVPGFAAAQVQLVCPHATAVVPLLPPDDRPTTSDCYLAVAGVHVPLTGPNFEIVVPASGAELTLSRRGRLISVTDSRGTKVPVGFGRLITFDDPDGAHVAINYDAAGRVTQLASPGGTITAAYSGERLLAVNDSVAGLRAFSYDAADQLVAIADAGGNYPLAYDAAGRISSLAGAAVARNAAGAITSAAGTTFAYDIAGRLTSATAVGNTTTFAYDLAGSLTTMTAAGATWNYVRNALGATLSASDGTHTWAFAYDSAQRLIAVTDPAGASTHRAYDARGDLAAVAGASGLTQFTYDANRRLTRVSYADASQALATYAASMLQTVCPHAFLGAFSAPEDDVASAGDCFIATIGGVQVRLDGSFTVNGPLNPAVAAFRLTSTGGFADVANGRGDRAQVMGGDVLDAIVAPTGLAAKFTRTAANLPGSVTDAAGAQTRFTYDSNGRLIAVVDAVNATTHFVSTSGRLLSITDPNGQLVASFQYDSSGRLVSATDGLNSITRFVWAAAGVTSIQDPIGNTTNFSYDAGGRLLSATTQSGPATQYTYDGSGNLVSARDVLARTWLYQHDAAGHLTRSADPLGNAVLFVYSADGILISRADQLSHITTFTHSQAGDFLSIINPVGAVTAFTYNANRSTTAIIDPLNRSTRFLYTDGSPPVITVPAPIVVDATSPSGAVVNYVVSASDPDDFSVSLSCIPQSGSTFAIGTTTVTCQASDAAGNAASSGFTVTVRGPSAQIDTLALAVKSLALSKGLTTALLAKLAAAQAALAVGDSATGCGALADFIGQVQAKAGKEISTDQANSLIAAANQVRSALGC